MEHSTVTETHREVTLTGLKGLLTGRRRRVLREYLTGYLMILPSTALVFLFGIFPVAFALYVSMQKWRLKRGDFIGMDNFVRALGNLAYILFFLIAISALVGAVILFRRIRGQAVENEERPWLLTIPAVFHAAAVLALFRWLILLLPEVLDIAGKIIGVEKSRELFVSLLGEAFQVETVLGAFQVFIVLTLISLITGFITSRLWKNPRNLIYQSQFAFVWLTASIGVLLLVFTYQEVAKAYQLALETGTDPGIWPQVITIGSGILLLVLAWIVWRSAEGQSSNRSFWFRLFAALFLLVAGWVLIAEIPIVMAAGDDDVWQGLKVTIFYSLGTVPFQLGISLFLAILLFQKLTGSGLFRMLFFLPYVTPFVASAVVFRQMFSIRPQAPVNQFIGLFGV